MANQKEYLRTKEGSSIAKIVVDRDLCIGAASCIAVAGAAFELDPENKAVVISGTGANAVDDETLIMAAQSCPTKAILLFDKSGAQVYPK
jgi:ferredoxin